jgi:predicted outer membrane protein
MYSIRNALLVLALGFSGFALANDPEKSNPANPTTGMPATGAQDASKMSDEDLARTLANIEQAQVDEGSFVVSKTTNADVKKLAQSVVDDNAAMLKKTQEWMTKNGASLTSPSNTAHPTGTGNSATGSGYDPNPGTAGNPTGATFPNGTTGANGANGTSNPPTAGSSGMSGQTGTTGTGTATGTTTGTAGQPGGTDPNGGMYGSNSTCPPGQTMGATGCVAPGMSNPSSGASGTTPTYGTQPATGSRVGMADSSRDQLAQLQRLSGAELDRRYVATVVEDNQRMLQLIDSQYMNQAKNGDLKTLLKDSRAKVNTELEAARKTQKNLADKEKPTGTASND